MELIDKTKSPTLTTFNRVPVGGLFKIHSNDTIVMKITECTVGATVKCNSLKLSDGTVVKVDPGCRGFGVIGVLAYELE